MLRSLLPLALVITAVHTLTAAEDPRAVVRAATRAVEVDSAAQLERRLTARAARDSNDRAALLGLATLARLRYEYPAAERTYRRLFGAGDRFAVYAHLGMADGLELRRFSRQAIVELEAARRTARAVGERTGEGEALLRLWPTRSCGTRRCSARRGATARCAR